MPADLIGVSLSEPHINVLNASGVCMYACVYAYIHMSYCKLHSYLLNKNRHAVKCLCISQQSVFEVKVRELSISGPKISVF